MAEGPVGELEELIVRAFAQGPETMNVADAAIYLAQVLAPKVVLRTELEHIGWTDDHRATFCVPPRVVNGAATLVIPLAMSATD